MTTIRVVDFETGGLAPPAKVVEWAYFDLIDLTERGAMASGLCDSGGPIPPDASACHHLVWDDVKGKPSFEEQIPLITNGSPDIWCAHNAKFDRQWFNPEGSKWIDTWKLALRLWPDSPSHSNQCLRYYLDLKLADPAGAVPHRAYGDSYVTCAILRRALKRCSVEEAIRISEQPAVLPRLGFGKHAMVPIAQVSSDYLDWIIGQSGMDEDVRFTARAELHRRHGAP